MHKDPGPSSANAYVIDQYEGESHDSMESIRELRKICWEPIYRAGGTMEDGFDDVAFHGVAFDEKGPVAAARLTIHSDLKQVPDSHLFEYASVTFQQFPLGYMSRLVVHPRARGRGLPAVLDEIRINCARTLKCVAMVGIWNPRSGEKRRRQLIETGFRSLDGNTPYGDGLFGESYVYFMNLGNVEEASER